MRNPKSSGQEKNDHAKALKTIRAGGRPAVMRFVYKARDRYRSGGEKDLRVWIAGALSDLPEDDKAEMLAMLLGTVFDAEK